MPRISPVRIIVITSILIALAAIAVSANWGSGFGLSLFSANETVATEETAGEYVPDGLSASDWDGIRVAYEAGRISSIESIGQEAYLKPGAIGTTQLQDRFGTSVAVSGDTVVVGAYLEDSSTTGVNSTPNELSSVSGAAYVFIRTAGVWTQQAYLKPAAVGTTQSGDNFGYSVAVSGDTVVVGAIGEDSGTTGINSTPDDTGGLNFNSGAAYVFTRSGGVWTQQAYLKPAAVGTTQSGDNFGYSVAVSGDTVVVGALTEDSGTTGVNSTPNESAVDSGAAYVFTRSAGVWTQEAYLKPADVGTTQAGDNFGVSVAVSGDKVVVGAWTEDSSTTGVNSTFPDEISSDSGAAYVFTRSASVWTQEAYLKTALGPQTGDNFGVSVAVSGDTVVVGARLEDSGTTGVNSTADESASNSGAAYVFTRSVGVWTQQAYLKPAAVGTTQEVDFFGWSVAVAGDTVVVGAEREDSGTTGVNSTADESSPDSGAAYVFTRSAGVWTQQAYLKPTAVGTTQAGDQFGHSVAVSGDNVVVGAWTEDSNTTGVNSTPNELANSSGAVYVFADLGPASPTPTNTPTDTPTPTATSTSTATNTPTDTPTPSLGNYPPTNVVLSDNITITPNAAPTNTTSISVETTTGFVGELTADPVTGVVRVTNAHHANIVPGSYAVTVRAFGPGGMALTTFSLTVATPTVCNPVSFASPIGFPVDTQPTSIAVGDFNGDGNQDLATSNDPVNNVSVLLGDGSGGFGTAANFGAGSSPNSLTVGDFNGDGKQDMAVANANSGNVSILLGNGAGSFGSAANFAAGTGPSSVTMGDFNSDGKPDLAVANYGSNNVSILLGDGAGNFGTPTNFVAGTNPNSVAVGDFNGDGKQDLALANYNSANVSFLLGDGTGLFGTAANFGAGSNAASVAVGDFNDDGKQDLAVANRASNNVSVLLGDGMGSFSAATNFGSGSQPFSVAVGDFNGDGEQDLVLGKQGSFANISLLLGNGAGSFSPVTFFNSGNVPYAVAVGDFNGDGKQDIATANRNSNDVSILSRNCAATPTATNTPTSTATPTPAGTPSVSGTVTYGNAAVPPKYISNVTLTGTGSPNVFTTTAAPGGTAGQYTLTGFGAGSYTVSLSKTTGQNGVSSADAARIAQHVAGTLFITSDRQKIAADVTNNGALSSTDAAQLARFVTALGPPIGLAGQWRFFVPNPTFPIGASPTTRTYPSITSNITGDDYIGILVGEVTGNWNPTAARPGTVNSGQWTVDREEKVDSGQWIVDSEDKDSARQPIAVAVQDVVPAAEKDIVVPVSVEGIADKGVISYEFDLRYDPSVMQPVGDGVDVKGTISRGLSVVTNATEPGLLRVVVYGAYPIVENGVLLNLRFAAVGGVGSISNLKFENVIFNEGESRVSIADGEVRLY